MRPVDLEGISNLQEYEPHFAHRNNEEKGKDEDSAKRTRLNDQKNGANTQRRESTTAMCHIYRIAGPSKAGQIVGGHDKSSPSTTSASCVYSTTGPGLG